MSAAAASSALEVATFGETLLRLSPPPGWALEQTQTLELSAGGAESNMAIALARLGHRVGWVSRLPADPLGRRIARDIAAHGVDTSRVVWVPEGKVGLLFIETGSAPRGNLVLYDRAHTAISELQPGQLPLDYLCSARMLFLTGITPALSASCRAAWIAAARAAKQAGRLVAVDVNYRSKLWPPDAAREALEEVFPFCDLLFASLRDVQTLFGMPKDAELAGESFRAAYRLPLAVLTLGAHGALAVDAGSGGALRHPVFPTQVQDRIGAGDAFAAGFVHGWLQRDVAWGLRCGCALAALKQTYRGDTTWSGCDELEQLVSEGEVDPHRVRR